jgi:hypothetical protein
MSDDESAGEPESDYEVEYFDLPPESIAVIQCRQVPQNPRQDPDFLLDRGFKTIASIKRRLKDKPDDYAKISKIIREAYLKHHEFMTVYGEKDWTYSNMMKEFSERFSEEAKRQDAFDIPDGWLDWGLAYELDQELFGVPNELYGGWWFHEDYPVIGDISEGSRISDHGLIIYRVDDVGIEEVE